MTLDSGRENDNAEEGDERQQWNTHFSVEYSNSMFNDAIKYCRYFKNKARAIAYAETIRQRFRCVWLLECGSYETNAAGHRRRSWIYFWWSPAVVPEWGSPPDAGWGRPINTRSSVRYQPEPLLSPNIDDLV